MKKIIKFIFIFYSFLTLMPSLSHATLYNTGAFWKKKSVALQSGWTKIPCESMPRMAIDNLGYAAILTQAIVEGKNSDVIFAGQAVGCEDATVYDIASFYDTVLGTWNTRRQVATELKTAYGGVINNSKVITWGGGDSALSTPTQTGTVYDSATNSWSSTSLVGAPSARFFPTLHSAGTRVIVWGGIESGASTGAVYNPSSNVWSAMGGGSPSARMGPSVWTGTHMVVWGGVAIGGMTTLNNGGRYNLSLNTWQSVNASGAPSSRGAHSMVWTGSRVIVWGGGSGVYATVVVADGAIYNSAGDSWATMSSTNAPSARRAHSAIWTGTKMIVWGGTDGDGNPLNSGGIYDPSTDTWSTMAPAPIFSGMYSIFQMAYGATTQKLTYSNGKMAVVTPFESALYDVATNTWSTFNDSLPGMSPGFSQVWAGSKLVIAEGNQGLFFPSQGSTYDPVTKKFSKMSTVNSFKGGEGSSFIAAGSRAIGWGGKDADGVTFNTGASYNVSANTWSVMSTSGAPSARESHSAVWNGSKMIVWGGGDDTQSNYNNDGGIYDPVANNWTPVTTTGAPSARKAHFAAWLGTRMVVYGGISYTGNSLFDGGIYNPDNNSWSALQTTGAPGTNRIFSASIAVGTKMIFFGGSRVSDGEPMNNGFIYDLSSNSWSLLPAPPVPYFDGAWPVGMDNRMALVGMQSDGVTYSGHIYNFSTNTWTAMNMTNAPSPRMSLVIWSGTQLIVFGGMPADSVSFGSVFGTGAVYTP